MLSKPQIKNEFEVWEPYKMSSVLDSVNTFSMAKVFLEPYKMSSMLDMDRFLLQV